MGQSSQPATIYDFHDQFVVSLRELVVSVAPSVEYLISQDLQKGRRYLAAVENAGEIRQSGHNLAELQEPSNTVFSLIGVNLLAFIL